MIMPEVTVDDILLPENDQDLVVWNSAISIELEETQPVLHKYLLSVLNQYGENACLTGLIVYSAIKKALENEKEDF